MARSSRSPGGGVYRIGPLAWRRSSPGILLILATAIGVVLAGSKESVRHYKVPKPEVLYAANHVDVAGDRQVATADKPTDRMLGAIVPRDSQTWYFKMTGPMDLVAQQEQAFRQLIESLRFDGPDASPQWTLPDSWQENEGTGQRTATLSVEVEGHKLEVSIIQLATSPSPTSVLDNVNRWRRQMGLTPIEMEQLDKETSTITLADGTAVLVNLVGNFASGGMGSRGMAGGAMAAKQSPSPAAPRKTGLKYEKPDGWLDEPPVSFSVLAFGVRDGDATAQVTVSLEPMPKRWATILRRRERPSSAGSVSGRVGPGS
jgi:hypothetical protein